MSIISIVALATLAGTTFLYVQDGAAKRAKPEYRGAVKGEGLPGSIITGNDISGATEFQDGGKKDRPSRKKTLPKRAKKSKRTVSSGAAKLPNADTPIEVRIDVKVKNEDAPAVRNIPVVPRMSNDTLKTRLKSIARRRAGDIDPSNMEAMGRVDLGPEALARLGIRAFDMGIYSIWQEPGKEKPFSWIIASDGVIMPPEKVEGVEIPNFSPAIITDDLGGLRAIIYEDDPEELRLRDLLRQNPDPAEAEELNRKRNDLMDSKEREMRWKLEIGSLVPVLVRSRHGQDHSVDKNILVQQWRPNAIFWYEPRPEFLERLPDGVRMRIEREMQLADRLRRSASSVDGAGDSKMREALVSDIEGVVGKRPYLDVLRGSAGALLETALHPNPAHGLTKLRYRLAAPRTMSLTLHDLAGQKLREIAVDQPKEEGEWEADIDLAGLAKGMYLLWITTDKGERVVQRLIIQR